jgi:hypothetical protein
MTVAGGPVTTDADVDGRFAFLSVPRGTARIVVRQQETEQSTAESRPGPFGMKAVITPALVL